MSTPGNPPRTSRSSRARATLVTAQTWLADWITGNASLLTALAAAGLTFWVLGQFDRDVLTPDEDESHAPDYYMEDMISTFTGPDGQPVRRIESELMEYFKDTDTHEFEKPYMQLFREVGEPWHVKSERGWVSANGEVMLLLGKVHIWRNKPEGARAVDVHTSDLRVLPKTEYGETDKPVTIRTPTMETKGVGMRAWLGRNKLEIISDVHTHYIPDRGQARAPERAPEGQSDRVTRGVARPPTGDSTKPNPEGGSNAGQ